MQTESLGYTVLAPDDWRARETAHRQRTTELTAAHSARRERGEKHPIEDFLYTYYPYKPSQLAKWHPGAGVILTGAAAERADWRDYRAENTADATLDLAAFFTKRGGTVAYIKDLLQQTLERTPRFGCFGLHEWAMVYHLTPEQLRHRGLKLRLGSAATDTVVETNPIACSHFDAYRFFTPDAAPLNELTPTRETQPDMEQAGCLHAGMDVYKWAIKLGPIIPGELLLDTFTLARDIRILDMRASPYDVSGYGYTAVPIETTAGKKTYAAAQREFAARGNRLRERVLAAIALAEEVYATDSTTARQTRPQSAGDAESPQQQRS